ncbi:polysaccharide pyruvyl transferase family protein [Thermomonospora catenispora]|uniref:polysaccharide pyruvyl transferase family protein n=1 Tax=Thermomonospora catenispora TaxID=2493090 RepID=UPI001122104D|nr:polysaccharide pyruvyl transferase family protein [Thermomonospora catenispora]TNY36892.1 polysaccharide pyruvyl transferase family protein [Thermomonospora catenispora]
MYYLVGTTGHPNYGDELIAAVWLRHLAEAAPDAEVWLDCPHPGTAAVMLSHLHPNVQFTDTFWRLCREAPDDGPWQVARWVRRAIGDLGMAPRWGLGRELAARAEVVHIIGGGYINGLWPRHYGLLAAAVGAVERSGGRAVMTGQGLWPVPEHGAQLLRDLAAHFALVDVRDEPSAQVLGDVTTVTATGDDVLFGLGPHLYRPPHEPLREVVLCLQSDLLSMPRPALASFVSAALRSWGVTPEQVAVVEGIPGVDRAVFDLLEPELPGARFHPFLEVWRHGLPAGPGQTWISTRFHLHLLAAAAGASGVAVSVNPDYYAVKHRSLIRRGSRWTLSDATDVPERPAAGGFDHDVLEAARREKRSLAAAIYGR